MSFQDKQIRLQVYLAHSGVASRRKSEEIIISGRVKVNGEVITSLGTKVSKLDKVLVDDKLIELEKEKKYILLNKPVGYVSSLSDEKGRSCAIDLIQNNFEERLYNVGRLDMYSSGALLFTNDGEFAKTISHPSSEIEKEYYVQASNSFNDDCIKAFLKGIRIDNVFYKAKNIKRISSNSIKIILIEGKNREIRRVLNYFDIRIKILTRIRIGNILLNSIKEGEFRELTQKEVNELLSIDKVVKNNRSFRL